MLILRVRTVTMQCRYMTAYPDPGWTFSNWTGDRTGTANPMAITMNV